MIKYCFTLLLIAAPLSYAMHDVFDAVTVGCIEQVKKALKEGVSVNTQNPNGASLLIVATQRENEEIVKFLIEQGADVNHAMGGITPLMIAAAQSNTALIKLLLNAGADVNAKTQDNTTAIMCTTGKIIAMLTKKGADISGLTGRKRTFAEYIQKRLPVIPSKAEQ